MMLCEDEGRVIWMPKRNVKVSSGNRPGELTNHIWHFKPGWGQSDETLMDAKCPHEDGGDLPHGATAWGRNEADERQQQRLSNSRPSV